LWNAADFKLVKQFKMHDGEVAVMVCVREKEVWSASVLGEVKVWDMIGNLICKPLVKSKITSILELPDNKLDSKSVPGTVWLGGEKLGKGSVEIWDASGKKRKKSFDLVVPTALISQGESTCPKPLAMMFHGGHVWVASGRFIYCFEPTQMLNKGYLSGHAKSVRQLLSIGKEIWSCGEDKLIKVWNPEEKGGSVQYTLEGHFGDVLGLCTDGSSVFSCGCVGKQLYMWDIKTHIFVRWLPEKHRDAINCVLAVKGNDGSLRIWSGGQDSVINVWTVSKITSPQ